MLRKLPAVIGWLFSQDVPLSRGFRAKTKQGLRVFTTAALVFSSRSSGSRFGRDAPEIRGESQWLIKHNVV